MKSLKRTQVGDFKIENSITIEELNKIVEDNKTDSEESIKNLNEKIISIEKVFENKQSIKLPNKKLELFLNGVMLTQNLDEDVYKIYNQNNEFIGTGIIKNNLLKRDIIKR